MPVGLAEFGGNREAVGGIVLARRGADPITVIDAVKRVLDRERAHLPESVQIVSVYDRSELAKRAQETLTLALAEEVAAVVFVIALFLLHGPSALVPLVTLPVVLALTFAAMWLLRLPATVMSLGGIGIALGMAVDADIVALEACHRRLEASASKGGEDRRRTLIAAAGSFAPAILTAFVITGIAFLPILAFPGETGRLLRPLALTKTLVVAAASIVTLTLAPAVRDRLLVGRVTPEFDNPVTRRLVAL
jgi:Cu(I)/Ag(I) efflux system membrane protein CusA/SilA